MQLLKVFPIMLQIRKDEELSLNESSYIFRLIESD